MTPLKFRLQPLRDGAGVTLFDLRRAGGDGLRG